ncbi:signal peptidase II [Hathewaya histolytica]|uniref:Lipoprotein signal peptidase n=1 Tax=Hathewaya histolytica TaxID=1498 RepID=A0A4U9R8W5_HATHI|nr:lipoprotein signal peptidase [Hathewaya histolytica]
MEIIIFILGIILDRISKLLAIDLKGRLGINLIPNFLTLEYLENRGAAFGIMQNKQWLLIILTILIMIVLLYMFFRYRHESKILNYSLVMIFTGAIGNLYDRIFYKYVIDFISVHYKDVYYFPTFNIADIMVVLGTFLLALYIMKGEK